MALLFRHARCGDMLVSQVIGNALVTPAFAVKPEDFTNNLCGGLIHFKLHCLAVRNDITIGNRTDPASLFLPPLYYIPHLFRGVRDRHLIDKKAELNRRPVVERRIVDAVSDRDDAHSGIAQVFKLDQPFAVAAGEAGKVFDDEDVIVVPHHLPAQHLVTLALLKSIAGTVAVFVEVQLCCRELLGDIIRDDCFLVLD